MKGLETDPKSFLIENANIELQKDAKFNIVENSNDIINLTLPYYSEVADLAAVELTAEQMEEVAGGEFIIAAIVAACASVGGAVVAAAGGMLSVPVTCAIGGAIIAGGIGAGAAAAGGAAAGVGIGIAAGVRGSKGKRISGKKK